MSLRMDFLPDEEVALRGIGITVLDGVVVITGFGEPMNVIELTNPMDTEKVRRDVFNEAHMRLSEVLHHLAEGLSEVGCTFNFPSPDAE